MYRTQGHHNATHGDHIHHVESIVSPAHIHFVGLATYYTHLHHYYYSHIYNAFTNTHIIVSACTMQ